MGELEAMRSALADVLASVGSEAALPPAAFAVGLELMDAPGTDLPAIGDASGEEALRLAALMRRQML